MGGVGGVPASPEGAGVPARPRAPRPTPQEAPRHLAARLRAPEAVPVSIHPQAGRLWHVSCDEQPELCRQIGDVPAFEAWAPGGGAERYAGRKSTEGLVEFVRLKVELEQRAVSTGAGRRLTPSELRERTPIDTDALMRQSLK